MKRMFKSHSSLNPANKDSVSRLTTFATVLSAENSEHRQ